MCMPASECGAGMSQINWSEDLSVGLLPMDKEHKVLVGLINALELAKSTATLDFIERILNTLEEYTKNHFAHEERIMKKMSYPGMAAHFKQHREFEKRVAFYLERFKTSTDPVELLEDVLRFLTKWLIAHIRVEDKRYSEYLLT